MAHGNCKGQSQRKKKRGERSEENLRNFGELPYNEVPKTPETGSDGDACEEPKVVVEMPILAAPPTEPNPNAACLLAVSKSAAILTSRAALENSTQGSLPSPSDTSPPSLVPPPDLQTPVTTPITPFIASMPSQSPRSDLEIQTTTKTTLAHAQTVFGKANNTLRCLEGQRTEALEGQDRNHSTAGEWKRMRGMRRLGERVVSP